jgi:tRNA(Ile)-lysidine synthase
MRGNQKKLGEQCLPPQTPRLDLSEAERETGGLGGAARLPQPSLSFLAFHHASRRPAIAVSGGADSMALALLAKSWGDPLALIVDHTLRRDSAAEAHLTAARLATLNIPARILTLNGLTPGPGLAARARAARYDALTAATREAGRVDLWLGHHRRDQAETILMRRLSHSAAAGLAGMAALAETQPVRLLRPLLGTPPGALRALLRAAGIAWVEDPSNSNPAALRTRLRATLNDPDGDGPDTVALADQARTHARARARAETRLAADLAGRVAIFPEGFAILAPGAITPDALGALIRALTGAAYAAGGAALARLAADPRPATLGGVRVLAAGKLGCGLVLAREPAAMAAPIPALPGAVWDRRFLVHHADGAPAMIGAVGPDAPALRRLTPLPAAILRTLPALRVNGVLVEVPHIGYRARCGSARMAVGFAPATPASGAPFGSWPPGDAETEASPHLHG